MTIEPANGLRARCERPGDAGSAGSAAQIDDRRSTCGGWRGSALEDLARDEQVLRTVEERERRALAGREQRAAFGQLGAALDVAGRQRPQRTRDPLIVRSARWRRSSASSQAWSVDPRLERQKSCAGATRVCNILENNDLKKIRSLQ